MTSSQAVFGILERPYDLTVLFDRKTACELINPVLEDTLCWLKLIDLMTEVFVSLERWALLKLRLQGSGASAGGEQLCSIAVIPS